MLAYYSSHMPESPTSRIATNLRALRTARDLSIVTLAKHSGVARATLTKLEAGQGNPTIDTLYALADSLGVALGDLIGEPASVPGVLVLRAGEGTTVHGAITANLLDRVHGHRLAEVYTITFSTRRRNADPHPAGTLESIVVVSGHLRTGPAAAPADLGPGDYIRFPGDVPHLYQGIDATATAVLVMSHP
jgi:transcriptional regulator with XRE-family HTH domain